MAARSSCFVAGLVARHRNAHVLGKLIASRRDLTHSLKYPGVVVAFPALVAHPSMNILDDNQGFPVPEVFTSPLGFQMSLAAERAELTCHI